MNADNYLETWTKNIFTKILEFKKIGSKDFKLYPFQEKILQDWEQYDINIVMACRQAGITTLATSHILYHAITNENTRCLLVTPKADSSSMVIEHIMEIIKKDNISIKNRTKNKITLLNGSTICAVPSNYIRNNIKGYSIDYLFLMDYNCFHNKEEILKQTITNLMLSKLSLNGNKKIIITGLPEDKNDPNGIDKLSNIFKTAKVNKIIWSDIPERDVAWKNKMIGLIGEEIFKIEFECIPQ